MGLGGTWKQKPPLFFEVLMKKINWQGESTTDISEMMGIISDLSYLGLFDQVDYIIATMPLKIATSTMLTSVLRISSSSNSILPSWQPMVTVIYHELKTRGDDADGIMWGLV